MKTTNFEISKKLKEIGFKAKAEKCWAKIRRSVLSEFDLVNLDFTVPQNCDEWVSSYDLETLLDALPVGIDQEDKRYDLVIEQNSFIYYSDTEGNELVKVDRKNNESLADTAGRAIILLYAENLIKF